MSVRLKKEKRNRIISYFSATNHHIPVGGLLSRMSTWQSLHGEATERPLKTRCPQPDFKGSLAPANSAQKRLPVSGLLLHDNNYEDDIPGRTFPDIKKKKTKHLGLILFY